MKRACHYALNIAIAIMRMEMEFVILNAILKIASMTVETVGCNMKAGLPLKYNLLQIDRKLLAAMVAYDNNSSCIA